MLEIVLFIHILICIAIIALVLIQQGKGADMGASFGAGGSNSLFGSRGPASFLMKLTGSFVVLFFVTSLVLGYLASGKMRHKDQLFAPPAAPATVGATKVVTEKTGQDTATSKTTTKQTQSSQ